MKPTRIGLVIFLVFFIPTIAIAQVEGYYYRFTNNIKVYGFGGVEKTLAWCGGFDDPQFSMADLNHDGKKDLVVYDRGIGLRTFINTSGSNYVYSPQYEANFPPIVNYLALADYNRDGIMDLFQQGLTGIPGFDVWKGYYNSKNELCFTHYQQLYYDNAGWGRANAYVNPSDIPAIVDIDNDGDLDFVAYETNGYYVYLYKNVQMEEGAPNDTIRVKLKDQCWGKMGQSYRLSYYLNNNCNNSNLVLGPGERTTHTGNTLCLVDMDGDGDKDYLGGNISYSKVVYCQNGKIPYHPGGADSMVSQDSTWQTSGHSLDMPMWPAIFNVDVDNDGKADLLISPNSKSENYKCIAYYKNTGTTSVPVFTYQADTFLVDRTIDLGSGAFPMFFDYNKDGKPDLFIGSDGYYQPDGTYKARVSLYLNTSTPGNPSFTLLTNNFLNLDTFNFQGSALAVGDLDNDGKKDLIIGHTNGTFSFFTNRAATDLVQPVWQLSQLVLKDVTNNTIAVGGNATPFIYDMDKDSKPDLVSGEYGGFLQYYQNVSTSAGSVKLKKINAQLGGVKVDGAYGRNSVPFIGKMDTTGKDYILMGSNSGLLYRYDGFQSGDTTVKYILKDSEYSYLDTNYLYVRNSATYQLGVYQGLRAAPAIADIDGDGLYEMVIGDAYGGLKLYRQDTSTLNIPIDEAAIQLSLYPNPARDEVYLSWDKPVLNNMMLDVISITGQHVLSQMITGSSAKSSFSVASFQPGLYIAVVSNGDIHLYRKFTITR